jgi:pilus assembly protein CpaE
MTNPTAAVPVTSAATATIASFLPCLGGVGNTTIALETALGMKRHKLAKAWKICYLDLDFQTSHVCDFLDTDPRLQITEIIDHPERLDDQLFEQFTNHHSSGLDVFAAPRGKIDPCEIGIGPLDALFDRIASRYDFVVVDLPVPWFVWTAPTLAHSDAVVITATNSVPCLRQLRSNLGALAEMAPKPGHTAVVINRAQESLFGRVKGRQHVDRVAADQKVFFVREDPQATDRVNTGTPASLGGPARNRKDFVPVVEFCTAAKRVSAAKGR